MAATKSLEVACFVACTVTLFRKSTPCCENAIIFDSDVIMSAPLDLVAAWDEAVGDIEGFWTMLSEPLREGVRVAVDAAGSR